MLKSGLSHLVEAIYSAFSLLGSTTGGAAAAGGPAGVAVLVGGGGRGSGSSMRACLLSVSLITWIRQYVTNMTMMVVMGKPEKVRDMEPFFKQKALMKV